MVTFEPTYGAPFPMEVSKRQKVLEIKANIQALRGIHVSRQTLIFGESLLHDDDVITLPPTSHVQVVITLVLPISPESMASLLPDGPDVENIRIYLQVPALKIWASLEMDPTDSVLGLKRKVEQLTEEIPTLGKKIEKLQVGFPDIKKKLEELRGNRGGALIPWEIINLRCQNGSELGDSRLLHQCGLGNRSVVIMSFHGIPGDCTLATPPPPLAEPPSTNAAVALDDQDLSLWVNFKYCDEEEVFMLEVKETDKVGVIWHILKDMTIELPKFSYYYFTTNDVMGGRALDREQTFESYSLRDGDTINIVPWVTAEGEELYNRVVLGLYL